jgi:exonuclease VII small subunit
VHLYGGVPTVRIGGGILTTEELRSSSGGVMANFQFEKDLAHLESIVPHVGGETTSGFAYWRRRIESLSAHCQLTLSEARRVARLAHELDRLEYASKRVAKIA